MPKTAQKPAAKAKLAKTTKAKAIKKVAPKPKKASSKPYMKKIRMFRDQADYF